MRQKILLAIGLLVSFCAPPFQAQNAPAHMLLPEFHLLSLDGQAFSSSDLNLTGRWVLAYVQVNCRSCNVALTQLKTSQMVTPNGSQEAPPVNLSRTLVIVVSGDDASSAKAFASQFPWLQTANWYIDSSHEAEKALALHGAPAFFGLENSTIEWRFSGVTSNPGRFNENLIGWMKSPLSAAGQAQLDHKSPSPSKQ